MAYDPQTPYAIRQFEIDVLVPIHVFGIDASFTTSAQAMMTTVLLLTVMFVWGARKRLVIPDRTQGVAETIYSFVANTVIRIAGPEAKRAVPLFFTIFVYIFFGSLVGLTPVKFTFTSHLIITFALALIVFIYVNRIGFSLHGVGYLRLFMPKNVPAYIAPVIISVELVSYLFRPITLGVRVFANILAGHIMIKTFADCISMLMESIGASALPFAIIPLLLMAVFYAFEVFVFALQSYIFIVISSFYLKDAINLH